MQWQITKLAEHTEHQATSDAHTAAELKIACEALAAQAIELLNSTIRDDSLYLMFEWQKNTQILIGVVADQHKESHSATSASLKFTKLTSDPEENSALEENIHFWLKDFLASYRPFFNYSLVAIFHTGEKSHSQLL